MSHSLISVYRMDPEQIAFTFFELSKNELCLAAGKVSAFFNLESEVDKKLVSTLLGDRNFNRFELQKGNASYVVEISGVRNCSTEKQEKLDLLDTPFTALQVTEKGSTSLVSQYRLKKSADRVQMAFFNSQFNSLNQLNEDGKVRKFERIALSKL